MAGLRTLQANRTNSRDKADVEQQRVMESTSHLSLSIATASECGKTRGFIHFCVLDLVHIFPPVQRYSGEVTLGNTFSSLTTLSDTRGTGVHLCMVSVYTSFNHI